MTVETNEEKEALREGGKRLAVVLEALGKAALPGVTASELDVYAKRLIEEGGDTPAFLKYRPHGAPRPYPATLCVSINDVIVHGIPNEHEIILREGDIVALDCGLIHKGLITDAAITVSVGTADAKGVRLIAATKEALLQGIAAARAGNTTGDIGYAVEQYVKPLRYGIPKELGGHGVGRMVHEDPDVPNYGKRGSGEVLTAGMVIAIEPMLTEGSAKIMVDDDGYTIRTTDGGRSAHFEHTVLITEGDPEILTHV